MRDPYLDNAKLALIILVVFGHLIEPIRTTSSLIGAVYAAIYLFHVPAFTFLAGVTTKTKPSLGSLAPLAIYLFIFQILYTAEATLKVGHYPVGFLQPYWVLWFLLSLIFWRLLLPIVAQIKYPVTSSVIISVGSGFIPHLGYDLSLSRTLVFLPCFVAGHCHGKRLLEWLAAIHPLWKQPAGFLLLGVSLAVCYRWPPDVGWLYGSANYQALSVSDSSSGLIRLTHLTVAAVLTAAFLSLIPKQQGRLTHLGERTLYVYLIHGLIVAPLRKLILIFSQHSPIVVVIPILALAAIGLTWFLSGEKIAKLLSLPARFTNAQKS